MNNLFVENKKEKYFTKHLRKEKSCVYLQSQINKI